LVGSVRSGFGFRFTDSQYQASPPLESVCGRSLRNLQGVPHLSPQYSSLHPMRSPCVGCATGAVVSGRHSGSPDSELLALVTRARCLLFDSHMGHILFPAWADTHTRTATCRALGYTRVRADMPTLTYTPLSKFQPVGNHNITARIHVVNRRGIAPVPSIICGR